MKIDYNGDQIELSEFEYEEMMNFCSAHNLNPEIHDIEGIMAEFIKICLSQDVEKEDITKNAIKMNEIVQTLALEKRFQILPEN